MPVLSKAAKIANYYIGIRERLPQAWKMGCSCFIFYFSIGRSYMALAADMPIGF
jgi:hypothetical protein